MEGRLGGHALDEVHGRAADARALEDLGHVEGLDPEGAGRGDVRVEAVAEDLGLGLVEADVADGTEGREGWRSGGGADRGGRVGKWCRVLATVSFMAL